MANPAVSMYKENMQTGTLHDTQREGLGIGGIKRKKSHDKDRGEENIVVGKTVLCCEAGACDRHTLADPIRRSTYVLILQKIFYLSNAKI